MSLHYRVAVNAPLTTCLTYLHPKDGGSEVLARGQYVVVPLGARKVDGLIMGPDPTPLPEMKVRPIAEVREEWPTLPENYLRWLEWISEYYVFPIGKVTSLVFPPLAKKGRRGISKKSRVVPESGLARPPEATPEQKKCLTEISKHRDFSVHLLHGVTGSGKTEVYLSLLEDVLARGEKGLVLVPEISLTPQLIQRFAARFGQKIAVIHSHLTDRERTEQWWSMVDGEKQILIGARSALFCPIENLGLIVVDEEHEPSFKQDEKLRYHARDSAIMLAKFIDCPIVLGSATPSLETWQNAKSGKYFLHQMAGRVSDRSMPEVEVVDLREERSAEGREDLPFWLSRRLHAELVETLARGEQAALFLNRRGVAQLAICGDCGFTYECPNCAISLTLHGARNLVCHYCDFSQSLDEHCPQCQSTELKPLGLGTELLEADLQRLFPDARLARADRDEVHSRESLEAFIKAVENREVDILVGTQMIAKGLDFPGLTLVGLVLADVGFNMPDFRASERSFQLLTQVGGRSGRHSADPGRVIVQTYNPDHPAVRFTKAHDFSGFCAEELNVRGEMSYPPFGRVALMRLQSQNHDEVKIAAKKLQHRLQQLQQKQPSYSEIQALGPAPSPIAKLRGKFRYQALIKCPSSALLHKFCVQILGDETWLPSSVKVTLDVDPMNML